MQQSKKQWVSNFDLEYRAFDAAAEAKRPRRVARRSRIEFCPECERVIDPRGYIACNPITGVTLHGRCEERRQLQVQRLRRLAAERRALVAHCSPSTTIAQQIQLAMADHWEARARALAS